MAPPVVSSLTLDAQGRVLDADAAACQTLNTARAALLGSRLSEWAPELGGIAEAGLHRVQLRPEGRGGFAADLILSELQDGRRTALLHVGAGAAPEGWDAPARDLAFLNDLNLRLRAAQQPQAILRTAAEMLGEHMRLSRVGYGEVEADGSAMIIEADWHDGRLGSIQGRIPLPPSVTTATSYGRGRTLVVDDYRRLDNVLPEELQAIEQMGIVGSITVPLIKEGRLVGLVAAQQSGPRVWTAAEVHLVEEVAERIWSALERARAEARLHDSEAQFRTLAENMPDICWVAEADGEGFWYNQRGESLFGPRNGQPPNLASYCHPDDYAATRQAWAHALRNGVRYETNARYRGQDGSYRPYLSRAEPVRDAQGRVVQWCGVLTDLSDQVANERRLRLLQQLNEALRDEVEPEVMLKRTAELLGQHLEASRVCYSEALDADDDVMSIAHAWTDGVVPSLGSRQRHSNLGSSVVAHHRAGRTLVVNDNNNHPLITPEVANVCQAVGYRAGVDVPLVKDGKLVAFLSVHQSEPRSWTDHEVSLIEEVAERTWAALERGRAEQQRQHSQALLAAITEHAPIGVYLRDHNGRYLMANPEIARVIGRPVSEIVGRTAAELLPPDLAETVTERDREVISSGRVISVEAHRPGRKAYQWSLVMRFPVRIGPDAPMQVAGFDIDITAQKHAESELKRSQEALYQSEKLAALGSLLAGVSHELNNPLSIIVAQAVMMERQAAGSPLADRAAKIRKAADRSARIVQTFLAMARQKRPERKRVNLNEVVNAALELTEYSLRTGGVKVVREMADDLPLLWADADQLHQVIVNLVINAQQAMGEQAGLRRLTIRTCRESDDQLAIEIADTGPGVPEDLRRRIFEPFFTTKPQSVGTGVGLSFSQGLVEAHGGQLSLLQTEVGATFRITLPVEARPDAELEAKPIGIAAPKPRRTALIVDDEPEIAESLADLLELEGFESEIVVGGRAAQTRLSGDHARFDVIISDLRMPDLDGPALFGWLSEAKPELIPRLAFATGDTLSLSAARFLERAGCPCLEKPFTPESLTRLLSEVDAKCKAETVSP